MDSISTINSNIISFSSQLLELKDHLSFVEKNLRTRDISLKQKEEQILVREAKLKEMENYIKEENERLSSFKKASVMNKIYKELDSLRVENKLLRQSFYKKNKESHTNTPKPDKSCTKEITKNMNNLISVTNDNETNLKKDSYINNNLNKINNTKELNIEKTHKEDTNGKETLLENDTKELENDTKELENDTKELENDTKELENDKKELENDAKDLENDKKELENDAKDLENDKKALENDAKEHNTNEIKIVQDNNELEIITYKEVEYQFDGKFIYDMEGNPKGKKTKKGYKLFKKKV